MAIARDLGFGKPVSGVRVASGVDGVVGSVDAMLAGLGLGDALKLLATLRGRLDGLELTVLARSCSAGATSRQVAGLLKQSSNMSSREAANRARRSETGGQVDGLVDDLTAGVITGEQADLLVEAAAATSADVVNGDSRFLDRVSNSPIDQARKHKNEWLKDHQSDGELVEIHQILRKARATKFWSTHEGMSAMYAEFDPVIGKQIRARVEADADQALPD